MMNIQTAFQFVSLLVLKIAAQDPVQRTKALKNPLNKAFVVHAMGNLFLRLTFN